MTHKNQTVCEIIIQSSYCICPFTPHTVCTPVDCHTWLKNFAVTGTDLFNSDGAQSGRMGTTAYIETKCAVAQSRRDALCDTAVDFYGERWSQGHLQMKTKSAILRNQYNQKKVHAFLGI